MVNKLILHHGHFTTLDSQHPTAEAIYIVDGKIADIGDNDHIRLTWGRPDVQQIDLHGAFAYPGLVDSHLHLAMYGARLQQLDLTECNSKQALLQQIRRATQTLPTGAWICGFGWDENLIDKLPTIQELDAASNGHPLWVSRVCSHIHLANSHAFAQAGVTTQTPDPVDGAYGRNVHGNLTGLVYENASLPFTRKLPKPTLADQKQMIANAMQAALALGLTAVHTDDLREVQSIEPMRMIYDDLQQSGHFLRTHHLLYHPYLSEWDDLAPTHQAANEWFSFGTVKIFADGTIGGRTAWLSTPYADAPQETGMAIHTTDALQQLAQQANKRGFPIAVHAIGDAATAQVLDIMAATPPPAGTRHRLIHAQFLRDDLLQRLAASAANIAVDIQPRFVVSDFPWVTSRIGRDRLNYAYAWRTMLDAQIPCAGGSDAPIELLSPLLGMHAAITRQHLNEPQSTVFGASERLSTLQALSLFTKGSAYAASEEAHRGTLTVGKYADISIFDRDLLTEPSELLPAQALYTVVNGQMAYVR